MDGYAGYNRLIAPERVGPDIQLAYCWAHARRKLVEITRNGSAPIAEDGVKRIGELYRIEAELRGLDLRLALQLGRNDQRHSSPTCRPGSSITVPVSRRSPRSAKLWPTSPNTGMV